MSVLDDLDAHFPGHRSDAQAIAWDAARARYPVGSSIRGVVVCRYPFGVFVDIGAGFPALLEIVRMADLTPDKYRADNWCPIGSELSAFIGGFGNRQIGLWQVGAAWQQTQAEPDAPPDRGGE